MLLCLVRPSLSAQTIYLSEDFRRQFAVWLDGLQSTSPCIGWEFGDGLESPASRSPPHGMYAAVNDNRYDNAGRQPGNSPIINCSVADSLRLEFDYFIPPDIDGRASVAFVKRWYAITASTQNGWNRFLEHPACLLRLISISHRVRR